MLDGCSITIAHHISIALHRSVSHNGPFLVPACSDGLGIQSSRDLEECTDRGRSGSQESSGAPGSHTVVGGFSHKHFPESTYNFCDIGNGFKYTQPLYPLSLRNSQATQYIPQRV